jgi:aldehyde:ferredoxin oxidoreductase
LVDGPEYETIAAFGSLAMVDDLEGVIYAGHLCNRYGLDTISTGCTIALACEMVDRGVLTTQETGGISIEYGDIETVHQLISMVAHREGFGATLAEGSEALAARYDVPELAATVNGLEVPMHDPRAFSGMAVAYALSPRGACHLQCDIYAVDTGQGPAVELGIVPGDRFENSEEKGHVAARQHLWRTGYNAWTLCHFQNPGAERVLRALNAATGWGLELEDLMTSAKRIVSLKRMLNRRRGLKRKDDRLPHLLLKRLDAGGTEGQIPNLQTLLAGAYAELGWDPESGAPKEETLNGLGLGFTIGDEPAQR